MKLMPLKIQYTIMLGALSLPLAAAGQCSTFDEGDEGWTEYDNGGQAVQWLATGGNPSGYIRMSDIDGSRNGFFEAPNKFLGDRSSNYGGRFEFDIKTAYQGQVGPFALQLVGETNLTLLFLLPPFTQEGDNWHSVTVPLVASSGWLVVGGTNATEDQLRYVLSDLKHLRIDGDLVLGFNNDTTGLDNACFVESGPQLFIRCSQVEVCWTSRADRFYDIQYRSDLTTNNWVNLVTNIPGNGTINCITDEIPVGEAQRYYQAVEHR